MSVRFWGVRGSLPCPGPQTLRYGGNTACVEVRCGDRLLVLDGGSGLRQLGQALMHRGPLETDILFSHFHIDHVIGMLFFGPAYEPANRFRLWSARSKSGMALADALGKLMSEPLFPVGTEAFKAILEFCDFRTGETLDLGAGIVVHTAALNHPGGASGYRIEYGGKAVAYLSDMEKGRDELEPSLLALANSADLLIYDSNFTDEEYEEHVGWGHSTWREGVRLAETANVKLLALFHHDPSHDDERMEAIAAAAQALRPATLVAREGEILAL